LSDKKALLLIGSPGGLKSNSNSLGTYLLDRLSELNFVTEKKPLHESLKSDKGKEDLLQAINDSDVIIFAFPLYVDSLPAATIRAMEYIAKQRKAMKTSNRPRFIAISNSGFPEAHQNHTALDICRIFAKETGFEWIGGLTRGMGPAIGRQPLESKGGMVRNTKKALELSAIAIAEGRPIPEKAVELMEKSFIPHWLYRWFGNRNFKRYAKKYGVLEKLNDQPYKKTD
jgi:hypothetical protein